MRKPHRNAVTDVHPTSARASPDGCLTARYPGFVHRSDLAAAAAVREDLASGAARKFRVAARVSAAEVARVVGVSRSAVSDWETGRCGPTAGHALAYGRALTALTKRTPARDERDAAEETAR